MTATLLHATCVAVEQRGVLILGPSGSGKSGLALQLMTSGAMLVSDDRTDLILRDGKLIARSPPNLRGMIEARGMGILHAPFQDEATVTLVVDLSARETDRLPPRRDVAILGVACDLVLGSSHPHFPAAVMCYLKYGRVA